VKTIFLKWWIFIVLISTSSIFCYYLGLSSKDPLPNKYIVYWAQIEEPDPNSEGSIFLLVGELESKNSNPIINKKSEPRVYQISYSKSLHESIKNMIENIKKGSVYVGGESELQNKSDSNPLENNGQFGFSHKSKYQYLYPCLKHHREN